MGKSTNINYKWPFSIAMLVYQRVNLVHFCGKCRNTFHTWSIWNRRPRKDPARSSFIFRHKVFFFGAGLGLLDGFWIMHCHTNLGIWETGSLNGSLAFIARFTFQRFAIYYRLLGEKTSKVDAQITSHSLIVTK